MIHSHFFSHNRMKINKELFIIKRLTSKFALLFLSALTLEASSDLYITRTLVTADCKKISTAQQFDYYSWAGSCPARSKSEALSFLKSHDIVQDDLPDCKPPQKPLDPPLGETLSQPVPDGYEIIDENVTDTQEKYYDGYGKISSSSGDPYAAVVDVTPSVPGIRINTSVVSGYCTGLSAGITFKSDVYAGVITIKKSILHLRKMCNQEDTDFPPLAQNQKIIDKWSEPDDRSSECHANNGIVQDALRSCKKQYRCVITTDSCPIEKSVPVGSYVVPRNGVFHEDIEITGADIGLHYSSADLDDTTIAHGWSLTNYARLAGNRLYLGSGTTRIVDTSVKQNNLTVIVSGDVELLFNAQGKLQRVRDLYTKEVRTTFDYDNMGRLSAITDIYGKVTTIERDADGVATAIIAPTGQRTLLTVNHNGDLTEVRYEDSNSYAFEYNNHLMIKEIEPNGNTFLHFFDKHGKLSRVVDAEQAEWNFDSETMQTLFTETVIKPAGDTTQYKNYFIQNGLINTEKVLPTGDKVIYTNAVNDTMSSVTSCKMRTTSLFRTNQDGTLYKDPYTKRRRLQEIATTTPNGLSKKTYYDKQYEYTKKGKLKRIIDSYTTNTKTATVMTDYKRHRTIFISPLGKRSHVQYDKQMRHPVHIKPYARLKTKFKYDNRGRVTKITTGKRTTKYAYDDHDNLTAITDPLKRTTHYSYDDRNRLTVVTYPDGTTLRYAYDANGNMTLLQTPTPADHTFSYNGVNKRTRYTSPMQKVTSYSYDPQRRITKITKPSGKTIETTYANGRVASVSTPEESIDYTYACQNYPSHITNGSEEIDYTYDGILLTNTLFSGTLDQSIAYRYNNDFLPTSITYANTQTDYRYNKDNELIQSGDFSIVRKEKKGLKIKLTDGTYTQHKKYNPYGELTEQKDTILKIKLIRNKLGQVVKKIEKVRGEKKATYRYTYDKMGRLITVKRNKRVTERYSYDSNGNRKSATINGIETTASYTLDDQLKVYGKNSYRYDDDGYLTEKTSPEGTTAYTYNTFGALTDVALPDETAIHYITDPLGRRIAKEVNGTITQKYLWEDLTTLLALFDKDDTLIWRFEYADDRVPVSMTDKDGNRYYLHYDQVGSLRAVSDTNGNIIKEIIYDSFGNILRDTNPSFSVPFGFAGGLYDPDTKLTHFGFREYDAYTGKWTAKDPILFAGGDSNLYGYVLGDPVGLVDPWGLSALDVSKMIQKMHEYVNNLNSMNLRRPGEGALNGMANNISSTFGSGYWGCVDQTNGLIYILNNVSFDDTWQFYDSKPSIFHHRVKAVSNNPNDPIVYLDPWKDEYEKKPVK